MSRFFCSCLSSESAVDPVHRPPWGWAPLTPRTGTAVGPIFLEAPLWGKVWGKSYIHIHRGICLLENAAFLVSFTFPRQLQSASCGSGICWGRTHFTIFPSTGRTEGSLSSHPNQNELLCFCFRTFACERKRRKNVQITEELHYH